MLGKVWNNYVAIKQDLTCQNQIMQETMLIFFWQTWYTQLWNGTCQLKITIKREYTYMNITLGCTRLKKKRGKIGKAYSPDTVRPRLLKSCAEHFISPLHTLLQASLDQDRIPSLWKLSKILPITITSQRKQWPDLWLSHVSFLGVLEALLIILWRYASEHHDPHPHWKKFTRSCPHL